MKSYINKFTNGIKEDEIIKVIIKGSFEVIEFFEKDDFKNFILLEIENIDKLNKKLVVSKSYITLFDKKKNTEFFCLICEK